MVNLTKNQLDPISPFNLVRFLLVEHADAGGVDDVYARFGRNFQARAVARRFNGKQTANIPPAEPTAESLSSSPA